MSRHMVSRYGFAVLVVAVAVTVRLALTPLLSDRAPYLVLAFAVTVIAWYAGFWPGVFGVLLSALAVLLVLVPPVGSFSLPGSADLVAAVHYVIVGLGIVLVADQARRRGEALRARNRELERLLEDNRALLALRDGFSGMLSHELRTPLTVILGNAELLRRWSVAAGDERGTGVAEDLCDEAQHLARLVEDLLVVSRGDGEVPAGTEPVLLQHLLPSVVARATRHYPRLTVHHELPPNLPAVAADAVLVEQALVNLLSNAAKYAGPTATVWLRARATGTSVALEVTDDGPGFPQEALGRVFDAFYRAPGTAREIGGAGVGLYVVRRAIEAMGGNVAASNAADGGAVVTIRLPVIGTEAEPSILAPSGIPLEVLEHPG